MGTNYRQLKAHGKSIVLERQENIVIERNDSQVFKRKQTIVREKFPQPNERVDEQHTTKKKQEKRRRRSRREARDGSENEDALVSRANVSEDSHEAKLAQTEEQLGELAHEIDIEIEKLKEQRDLIMKPQSPTKSPKRNAAIQNDMTWEQNLDANNSNIEFTIEKYSSQHKFVCTSPRYGRDEQTSCRPRMRTIGLQKNTHRSSGGQNHKKHEEHPAAKSIATAAAAAAAAHTAKEASFPASLAGCFEYVNDSPPNVLNVYHNHHTHNGGGGMTNDNSCRKYCQRYNATGNYNGLVCNQQTYVETGVTPCSEYNYCCDEYTYDYPNSCYVPLSVCCGPTNACGNCCRSTCCSCQPRHSRSRSHHRRCTDLQTDDFARFCTTSPDKTKRDKSTTRKIEEKLTKKYMIAISERQKQLESDELRERGERHQDADKASKSKHRPSKSKDKRESKNKEHQRASKAAADQAKLEEDLREKLREESAAKISKYLTRGGGKNTKSGSDDDSDDSSSLRKYKVKSKEKLLKITLTKQKQKHHISTRQQDSDDDCFGYTPSQCSIETLRTLKKMRITAYHRPSRHRQLRDEDTLAEREQNDSGRRGKQHRRKDDKYDDEDDDAGNIEAKSPRGQRKKKESSRDADMENGDDTLDVVGSDEGGKVRKYAEYIDKYKQGPDDEPGVSKRAKVKEEFKGTQAEDVEKAQPQRIKNQPDEDTKIAAKQEQSKLRNVGHLNEDDVDLPTRAVTRVPAEFETPQIAAATPQPPHAIYDELTSSVKRESVTFSPDTVARPGISPKQSNQENVAGMQYRPQPQVSRDVLPQQQQQYMPLPRHVSDTSDHTLPIGGKILEYGAAATSQATPQKIYDESQYDPSQMQAPQDRSAYERHQLQQAPAGGGTQGYPVGSPRHDYAEYDPSKTQSGQVSAYGRRDLQPVNGRQAYSGSGLPTSSQEHYASTMQSGQVGGPYERRDFQPMAGSGIPTHSTLKPPTGYAPPGASSTLVSLPYDASQIPMARGGVETYDPRSRDIQSTISGGMPTQSQYQPQYQDQPRPIYDGTPRALQPYQQQQSAQAGAYDRRIDSPSTSPQFMSQQLQPQQSVMGIRRWDATAGRRPSSDAAYQQGMQQRPQYVPQPQRFQYGSQKCEESRIYRDGKDVRFNICAATEECYEDEELQCAEEREHEVEGMVNLQCDTFEIASEYASARSTASTKRAPQPKVPEFTGCPCMFETYMNLVATYSSGRQRRNTAQRAKRTINC